MLFDEEYARTRMNHEKLLREADSERLAKQARLHTQQVLTQTAQSLQSIRPYVSFFDLIGLLFRSTRHAN
jgi:hypothetical protein